MSTFLILFRLCATCAQALMVVTCVLVLGLIVRIQIKGTVPRPLLVAIVTSGIGCFVSLLSMLVVLAIFV